MKQVLSRAGRIVVEEVPAPILGGGDVLVRVARSCISTGTESAGLDGGSLLGRAIRHPERVKELAGHVLEHGVVATATAVRHALGAAHPLGYSLAGHVHELGRGVTDLRVGDAVACAGAGHAVHAGFAAVPRNLVVAVPDGVSLDAASTVALGSIALHGVRRLDPTLGETFVVIGLGLLGQLSVQLLGANGCHTIGTDLDARRLALAGDLGLETAVQPDEDAVAAVDRITGGVGADGVLICAAGTSDEIVSSAFRMCRPKGRVVVSGDVGLQLRRADFYAKEIEFRIATSYGPGRYDPRYEEGGLDYPIGYVRWTEGRNMQEYLRLLAEGRLRIEPLIAGVHAVENAPAAYASLGSHAAPISLLSYATADREAPGGFTRVVATRPRGSPDGAVRTALVGAGAFASSTHLPNLKALPGFALRAVVSRTGVNARAAAERFGAEYATTDYDEVLRDTETEAVVICTRHDVHAAMTLAALQAGKHVLCEKPLALGPEQLGEIEAFYREADSNGDAAPLLLTGFNRRFSEHARRVRNFLESCREPAMLLYRMNAGHLPPDHWVHSPEGGGRNIGEACHVYDLFLYLIDSPVERVDAVAIRPGSGYAGPRDNFSATVRFADGSVATLVYTALGTTRYPKERLEAFADGAVAVIDDYRRLDFHGVPRAGLRSRRRDKGHREELRAFQAAIREGTGWPIPLDQQLEATRVSFRVEEALAQ